MDKNIKRKVKSTSKHVLWFCLIAVPILLIVCFALYTLIPSLIDYQYIVILILVCVGGGLFLIYNHFRKKAEEKRALKLKDDDPYK